MSTRECSVFDCRHGYTMRLQVKIIIMGRSLTKIKRKHSGKFLQRAVRTDPSPKSCLPGSFRERNKSYRKGFLVRHSPDLGRGVYGDFLLYILVIFPIFVINFYHIKFVIPMQVFFHHYSRQNNFTAVICSIKQAIGSIN